MNGSVERFQQAEARGIDHIQMAVRGRGQPFAHKRLHAIIKDLELATKREEILLNLARLAIQHQNIIARRAVFRGQAARAIDKRPDQNLPVIIPVLRAILMNDCQGTIKGDEGSAACLWIIKHYAQRGQPEMTYIENLVGLPAAVALLAGQREV